MPSSWLSDVSYFMFFQSTAVFESFNFDHSDTGKTSVYPSSMPVKPFGKLFNRFQFFCFSNMVTFKIRLIFRYFL